MRRVVEVLALSALLLLVFSLEACAKKNRPAEIERGAAQEGMASWYGKEFHGRPTASGERFDMHALTAAHPTLPFGARVRVTNLANGKSVTVRVNDRGPFTKGRIIDLSYAAAREIGIIESGTARVRVEILP